MTKLSQSQAIRSFSVCASVERLRSQLQHADSSAACGRDRLVVERYPYQKFGHEPGIVAAVTETAMSPATFRSGEWDAGVAAGPLALPREAQGEHRRFTPYVPVDRLVFDASGQMTGNLEPGSDSYVSV
jgi:hypothetical protein